MSITNLTFILCLLVCINSNSQNFIELVSGEKIYGTVEYRAPAFKKGFFLINDTVRYDEVSVRSFQIGSDYYRKISPPGTAPSSFYLRTVEGKIEAFTKISSQTIIQSGQHTNMKNRWDFYTIGDGPIKKVRYRFLKKDLQESKEAMKIIKQVSNLRLVSGVLYLGGSALIIGGISSPANSEGNSIPPAVIIGAIAFNANFFLLNTKRNKLLKAIDVYNTEMK